MISKKYVYRICSFVFTQCNDNSHTKFDSMGACFVIDFYTSFEITAEKSSIGVIELGLFMSFLGYEKKNSLHTDR